MRTLSDTLKEEMKNPEFKKEWDALEPEFQIAKAMAKSRTNQSITQEELAEKTGINQASLSRLERGTANPSIRTLQRLAAGLGMTLKVEFIPNP